MENLCQGILSKVIVYTIPVAFVHPSLPEVEALGLMPDYMLLKIRKKTN